MKIYGDNEVVTNTITDRVSWDPLMARPIVFGVFWSGILTKR